MAAKASGGPDRPAARSLSGAVDPLDQGPGDAPMRRAGPDPGPAPQIREPAGREGPKRMVKNPDLSSEKASANMSPTTQSDSEKLAENATTIEADLAALRSDVAKLAETLAGLVQHQTSAAREAVRDGVRRATSGAEEAASEAFESGRAAYGFARSEVAALTEDVNRTIERNPLSAVLIAMGIGFMIGLVSKGRQ